MIHLTRGVAFWLDHSRHVITDRPVDAHCLAQSRMILWITLAGQPDARTGMLINVAQISRVVRSELVRYELKENHTLDFLRWCRNRLADAFAGYKLERLHLQMNEKLSWAVSAGDSEMVEITVKYELAASHCLENPAWDREKNEQTFGRCSNPTGHGHNYTLEITLRGKPNPRTGRLIELTDINDIVHTNILDRFDHKNFNTDCQEFKDLLPTVENISRVFWELLEGRFQHNALARVRVWETANTYADYYGPGAGPLRMSERV